MKNNQITTQSRSRCPQRGKGAKRRKRSGSCATVFRHPFTLVKCREAEQAAKANEEKEAEKTAGAVEGAEGAPDALAEAALSDFDLIFDANDLIENPSTRLPVCLCLDVSGSMAGEAIAELNKGVETFYEALKVDEVAMYAADVCVIAFDSETNIVQEFQSIASQGEAPVFHAGGKTYMGEAVNTALDALEARKAEYRENGVDYFQPWLVLMTDGSPNGNLQELKTATSRTKELIEGDKLTVFPIGIGQQADLTSLEKFSPNRSPLRLQGFKFKEFFSWLSQSVSATSQSIPGESIPMDINGLKGWADLSL
ncbi:MAG: VWA domain-containing protein [Turicibacter sp.]|nr:VWA domain-containing protein [Turicibacter sp.]